MNGMPRPRPPHLHREITRHGTVVWYVRIGKGPRIRIRSPFGTPEFEAEYQAALKGERLSPAGKFSVGTLGWLVARYRESTAWTQLSAATRRQRENILKHVLAKAGREPASRIDKKTIIAGRDRRRETPNAARHFVQTMRGLFLWAVEAGLVREDPTNGVTTPRGRTDGHLPWEEEHCRAFEARWKLGTRERVAYAVLRYTGLRRGDAVRVGRPHVRDGVITIRTEKTGEVVTIPILPPLQEALDAGPIGELTFIAGERGRPMPKESFGTWFREACKAAGVDRSAHGLRKTAATTAAENGATVAELEAMFGWRGGGMAALYTKKADRARLSKQAAEKLLPGKRTA